jgi:hypothetical protein
MGFAREVKIQSSLLGNWVCANTITDPDPLNLDGCSILTPRFGGRSCGTSPMKPLNAVAVERSRVATEGWGAQLLARQSRAGNWGGPNEDRGSLITLYSLVVLMDLGLDPANKQARKMIKRVDKQLAFKPLNNRPFLDGETEPCVNGRILALGAYFKKPNDSLADQLLGQQLEDGGWNCEAVEPSAKLSSRAPHVPLASNR